MGVKSFPMEEGGDNAENGESLAEISDRNIAASGGDETVHDFPKILGKSWEIHVSPKWPLCG